MGKLNQDRRELLRAVLFITSIVIAMIAFSSCGNRTQRPVSLLTGLHNELVNIDDTAYVAKTFLVDGDTLDIEFEGLKDYIYLRFPIAPSASETVHTVNNTSYSKYYYLGDKYKLEITFRQGERHYYFSAK